MDMNHTLSDEARLRLDASTRLATWLVRIGSASAPHSPPRVVSLDHVDRMELGRSVDDAPTASETRFEEPDRWMSARHAELVRTAEGWRLSDLGSSNGTLTWGQRRSTVLLTDGDMFETGSTFWLFRSTGSLAAPTEPVGEGVLTTVSPRMALLHRRLEKVANSRVPLVFRGPTGSGKEVLAREVHRLSGRSGQVATLDVGTLPPGQVSHELFGVAEGVPDARPRLGRLRAAEGGTLIIDQLSDMPAEVQVALLRVLQDGEITPVGADRPVRVDLRFICTTSEDIEQLVEDGSFRGDLWSRLKGLVLSVPPVTERLEDVGLLISRFLSRQGLEDVGFAPSAYRALLAFAWPHNVRELHRCVESAAALSDGVRIEAADLPDELQNHEVRRVTERSSEDTRERELVRLLAAHRGNVSAVARSMGYSRMQVHRWMKQMKVDPNEFRNH